MINEMTRPSCIYLPLHLFLPLPLFKSVAGNGQIVLHKTPMFLYHCQGCYADGERARSIRDSAYSNFCIDC